MEFFSKDLIDIILKTGRSIKKFKKHYFIFEIAVSSFKSHFLFVVFYYPNLIVATDKFSVDKLLSRF